MERQAIHIKQAMVPVLLFIYAFGLIKPIIPLVSDIIAHTFFNSSHVATVHYEKGKYHIHLEVKEASAESDANQKPFTSEKDNLLAHLKTEVIAVEHFLQPIIKIETPYKINPIDLFQSPPFIPPKS